MPPLDTTRTIMFDDFGIDGATSHAPATEENSRPQDRYAHEIAFDTAEYDRLHLNVTRYS